jgi:CheY-like chemotaxis protein
VSLIISDINMPEMDGLEFLSRIKADPALKAIPVILLSGAPNTEIQKGRDLGAEGYVNKLYASAELYTEIDRVMAKHNKER